MRAMRLVWLTLLAAVMLGATAYGAGYAVQHLELAGGASGPGSAASPQDADFSPGAASPPPAAPMPDASAGGERGPGEPGPGEPAGTEHPNRNDPDVTENSDAENRVEPPTTPELKPGPALHAAGDRGEKVRDLQGRLKQIAWLTGTITGNYDDATVVAVRGFQAKREIPVTGEVDQRTLDRLHAMTREPTHDEKHNVAPPSSHTEATLDPRCTTGRALCVDKSSRTLRWVVNGTVVTTYDVRFGSSATPTREGTFSVESKSRDHVSSLYDTPMPFAMFFSGGQAVHYSSDFAARGYSGASHGCVNVRDRDGIGWLFDQVRVGDKVVVYWS